MLAFTAHCSQYLLTTAATWQTVAEVVAEGLDIRYDSVVTAIQWEGGGATVCTADGHRFSADAVIVTVSLGVLKVTCTTQISPSSKKATRLRKGNVFLPASRTSRARCQAFIFPRKRTGASA